MPSTGISVTNDCLKVIKSIKDLKPRYVIFSIQDNAIQVEKVGDQNATHEEFLAQFPKNDNRYALLNVSFEMPSSTDGVNEGIRKKTVFVAWSTDTSSVKSRFVYAASRKGLKHYLPGINMEIQAGTPDALSLETIVQKCLQVTK
jgi:cofilin